MNESQITEKIKNKKINVINSDEIVYPEINAFLHRHPDRLTAGTSLIDDDTFLGSGVSGSVIKARDLTLDKYVACKIILLIDTYIESLIIDEDERSYGFKKEIVYQQIAKTKNLAPQIHKYFYYKYNDKIYGIIVMDYLADYLTIDHFKDKLINTQPKKTREKIYEKYNKSLKSTLSRFQTLNIFIFDIQIMIKTDGTDIQIIDFGEAFNYKSKVVLIEGDKDFEEPDIMYANKDSYIEKLHNKFLITRDEVTLPRPTTRSARATHPYGRGKKISQLRKLTKKRKTKILRKKKRSTRRR